MEETSKTGNLSTPVAIVLAGAFIAVAIYFGSQGDANNVTPPQDVSREEAELQAALENMAPITEKDHIRGSADALVTIVEYSDFECPFCKSFHPALQQITSEYGDKVAWVYRHFPLDSLHPVKARAEAVAAECANELGGNKAFWEFTDRFFELTPSNNRTDIDTVLPQIAREIGLDESSFITCLESGKYDSHVQENFDDAVNTGGRGTPWSIVVAKNGKKYPLSGALPYELIQLIDTALKEQ